MILGSAGIADACFSRYNFCHMGAPAHVLRSPGLLVGCFLSRSMICAVVLCVAANVGAGVSQASESLWLTLNGDPQEARKNLVEVRPEPVGMDQRVVLDLRVSRDQQRTSFRGQKYRSYYAKAVVNCATQKAWYLWLSYYAQPQWGGEVVGREEYVEGQAPVLFKDIPGESYKRMISAACKVRG